MNKETESVKKLIQSTKRAEILLEENDFLIIKWIDQEKYAMVAYEYGKTGMANNEPWSRDLTQEQALHFTQNMSEAIEYFKSKHHFFHTEVKEVSFSDITVIDEKGIKFKDYHWITFAECVFNFKRKHHEASAKCIGSRDITATPPYIELYSTYAHDKIMFDKQGIFSKSKNLEDFNEFEKVIIEFGYSTYDLS